MRAFSMTRPLHIVAAFLALGIPSTSLHAAILFQHSGNADPTTESWAIGGGDSGGNHPGQTVGPLTNDAGSNDAWFVKDDSSVLDSNLSYYQTPSGAQNSQAIALGWSLSTIIRIPNASETAALFIFPLRPLSRWLQELATGFRE
jgi:hypothetical protein